MGVGANIRKTRLGLNISLKDLSAKSGVSLTSLYYIESDINSPTVNTLKKLADAMGKHPRDFLEEPAKASGE